MMETTIILKSSCIFTAKSDLPISGYLVIRDRKIVKVEEGEPDPAWLGEHTQIFDLKDHTICPGFADTHTFFTGYVIDHLGIDLEDADTAEAILARLKAGESAEKEILFGHDLPAVFAEDSGLQAMVEEIQKPVILFTPGHGTFVMNRAAEKYGVAPDKTFSEALVGIMPVYLKDRDFTDHEFEDYMRMLNVRGITSVKEMTFDHSNGLKEVFADFEDQERLTLRIAFMSQPVEAEADIDYGVRMTERFHSDFVSFSGFNQMTDGLIVCGDGDLLELYEGSEVTCGKTIDYENLERQVLEADKKGIRFTLHSEGDGAFHRILNIYDKCRKDENGKLLHRHGITDLELTTPADRKRMADLGVYGEAYVQMLMTDTASNWKNDVTEKVGERFLEYLNLRALRDAGVTLAAATDLPFMIPNVPESIYYGCLSYAQDGKEKVNPQNALTISEMLKVWTIGAQYGLGKEDILGTLEEGKLADIAVFDRNLFSLKEEDILKARIRMTIVNGKIVYQTKE